jgi:hypothetical protein
MPGWAAASSDSCMSEPRSAVSPRCAQLDGWPRLGAAQPSR